MQADTPCPEWVNPRGGPAGKDSKNGGATILPGVTIAESAIIGAGAVIVEDVKARSIVYGDAAKFRRDIDTKI